MAFDRTNQADLDALNSELVNDPISMGYAPVIDVVPQVLQLLNDPVNNVGGETASRPFDGSAVLDAYDPEDLTLNQIPAGADGYVNSLLVAEQNGIDISVHKDKFRALFDLSPSSATVLALDAQNVALSRAEVLFGQGTVIDKLDYYAGYRDYP